MPGDYPVDDLSQLGLLRLFISLVHLLVLHSLHGRILLTHLVRVRRDGLVVPRLSTVELERTLSHLLW
jgi:hypothetical protein